MLAEIMDVKPGPKPLHDYKVLWLEFQTEKRKTGLSVREFTNRKGLNINTIEQHFAKFNREAKLAVFEGRNPGLLLLAQKNIHDALKEDPDRLPAKERTGIGAEFKAKFSLDAFQTIADRSGLSPAATLVQIQNNNTNQVVVTPFFGETIKNDLTDLGEE